MSLFSINKTSSRVRQCDKSLTTDYETIGTEAPPERSHNTDATVRDII
ncbi:hypothetical protein [Microcoleus sp. PH2017_28_MFU_U_A]|nr:hypothetical protein [Microcoleus sp. PH2017_28_MFU_U_A]